MAIEIERKFLVANDGWRAHVTTSHRMRQGYLCGIDGKASVRVRIDGNQVHLNIKSAVVGTSRAEYDYAIPADEGLEILGALCVGQVEKTRHLVVHQGHTWEIDEFEGENKGLVIAEIELKSVGESFAKPGWLGDEVTDERRYYNHALSLHPYRHWHGSEC